MGISKRQMYAETDPVVDLLLKDMATRPIVHVSKYTVTVHIII